METCQYVHIEKEKPLKIFKTELPLTWLFFQIRTVIKLPNLQHGNMKDEIQGGDWVIVTIGSPLLYQGFR